MSSKKDTHESKTLPQNEDEAKTDEFAAEVLTTHNECRKIHGVPPVKLDPLISNWAQEWAERCAKLDMMERRPQNVYGENIYYSYIQKPNMNILSGESMVIGWYKESSNYNFDSEPSKLEIPKASLDSSSVGHFTQIVWKDTKRIGVGRATSNRGAWYVVVNYSPKGNYVGEFMQLEIHSMIVESSIFDPQNVPPPLSSQASLASIFRKHNVLIEKWPTSEKKKQRPRRGGSKARSKPKRKSKSASSPRSPASRSILRHRPSWITKHSSRSSKRGGRRLSKGYHSRHTDSSRRRRSKRTMSVPRSARGGSKHRRFRTPDRRKSRQARNKPRTLAGGVDNHLSQSEEWGGSDPKKDACIGCGAPISSSSTLSLEVVDYIRKKVKKLCLCPENRPRRGGSKARSKPKRKSKSASSPRSPASRSILRHRPSWITKHSSRSSKRGGRRLSKGYHSRHTDSSRRRRSKRTMSVPRSARGGSKHRRFRTPDRRKSRQARNKPRTLAGGVDNHLSQSEEWGGSDPKKDACIGCGAPISSSSTLSLEVVDYIRKKVKKTIAQEEPNTYEEKRYEANEVSLYFDGDYD
ncbi:unnamed protein product [Cyprideis torosa]|uniref:Uncharacterized protein n=1 Tax=Cyprideis torosa TaxID=163714 RepID=A0A7R8WFZ4_9CRUS|nr:unnamed protein product [Cyprideis torosa]CAG0894725.1 unnamed protein product [Cyprideis torosa]